MSDIASFSFIEISSSSGERALMMCRRACPWCILDEHLIERAQAEFAVQEKAPCDARLPATPARPSPRDLLHSSTRVGSALTLFRPDLTHDRRRRTKYANIRQRSEFAFEHTHGTDRDSLRECATDLLSGGE